MVNVLLGVLLMAVPSASAEDVDVAPALAEAKKPRWEPKGSDVQSLRGRARTKLKGKKYDEAVPMYLELMGLQPGCGVCLSELTVALANAGHHDGAQAVAQHLTELFPAMMDSWSRKLLAATEARDFETALVTLKELQSRSEKSWTHRWNEVDILLTLGRYDDAGKAIDEAAEHLEEGDVACYRARVAVAKPDEEAAKEAWASCETDGSEGIRDRVEGWRAVALRDWKTAALHAAQLDDAAAGDLAVAYLRMEEDKPESAVNLLNAAVGHHPKGRDLHVVRALAEYRAGNAEGAKAALEAQAGLGESGYWVLAAAHSDWAQRMGRHVAAVEAALAADGGGDAAAILDKAVADHGEGPELAWIREKLSE